MRITLAFISIVLLWSTTPLAIKWSGEGPGFLFAVSARMTIGLVCMLLIQGLSRQKLPLHSKALQTYLAVAAQIYASMISVYWGAQFIPSGWVSVIFGLLPIITALLAAFWIGERSLTFSNLLAYVFGIGGLWLLFGSALQIGFEAVLGIIGVLIATFFQAVSAVWVKRINGKIPAMTQVTGGLIISVPLYFLTWVLSDGRWPDTIPTASLVSIVYLGAVATTFGFFLFYYLLIHQSATRVALVTLVSPVMALLLGHVANQEPLTLRIVSGTALIFAALLIHEFFGRLNGSNHVETSNGSSA